MRGFALHPLVLAAFLTVANATKPVLVDDPAYLAFARHLATDPLHPYGFELYWYDKPQPAIEIVLPPVLPYWLALGIVIVGEHETALKVWLFPFAVILAYSARSLARRFAAHQSDSVAAMLTVGPGSLPFFNFMLDLPALALELAAVALAIRGSESHHRFERSLAVGVTISLALQTKYSVLGLPIVILALGWVREQLGTAMIRIGIGCLVFASWELAIAATHGRSHFLIHTISYAGSTNLQTKLVLVFALFAHCGLTAGWAGLARITNWHVARASVAAIGAILLAAAFTRLPFANAWIGAVFVMLGGLVLVPIAAWMVRAVRMQSDGWESRFLAIWLAIEIVVYVAVSPFPAGRRTLGIAAVAILIISRSVPLNRLVMSFGLLLGLAIMVLDGWDASSERQLPRSVSQSIPDRDGRRIYFLGHWGFQYYAEREGMRPIDSERTIFERGDLVLLPLGHRPNTGGLGLITGDGAMTWESTFIIDDGVALGTIPNLYAGRVPIASRIGPRLHFDLYRIESRMKPSVVRR